MGSWRVRLKLYPTMEVEQHWCDQGYVLWKEIVARQIKRDYSADKSCRRGQRISLGITVVGLPCPNPASRHTGLARAGDDAAAHTKEQNTKVAESNVLRDSENGLVTCL